MTTDALTPTEPPDIVRTRQPVMGPNHAAKDAAVSADAAAAGRGCEVPSTAVAIGGVTWGSPG
jgi:hypothetical protein